MLAAGDGVREQARFGSAAANGLVIGIHGFLRAAFSNQVNVKGFGFKNANAFFEGRTPLEIMAQGDLISLYETYRRIEQIHCGEIMAG